MEQCSWSPWPRRLYLVGGGAVGSKNPENRGKTRGHRAPENQRFRIKTPCVHNVVSFKQWCLGRKPNQKEIIMTSINKQNVFAVFQDADNAQAEFATRLFDLGVFSKAQAIPLVIEFVEQKYNVKAKDGQRGKTFEKDTAPHTAMKRILNNCFETVKTPSAEKAKKDEVELLIAKIKKLSETDQKRIKDAI